MKITESAVVCPPKLGDGELFEEVSIWLIWGHGQPLFHHYQDRWIFIQRFIVTGSQFPDKCPLSAGVGSLRPSAERVCDHWWYNHHAVRIIFLLYSSGFDHLILLHLHFWTGRIEESFVFSCGTCQWSFQWRKLYAWSILALKTEEANLDCKNNNVCQWYRWHTVSKSKSCFLMCMRPIKPCMLIIAPE